jgi:hypothetical protein
MAIAVVHARTMRIQELATRSDDGRRLEIQIQRRLKSPNEILGAHWALKARERKAWQGHLGNAVLLSLGVPAARRLLGPEAALEGCYAVCGSRKQVEITRFTPSRRNFIRDDDNLPFSAKPLLDALKHLALIHDDHRKWIDFRGVTQELSIDGTFWTRIVLEDIDGSNS